MEMVHILFFYYLCLNKKPRLATLFRGGANRGRGDPSNDLSFTSSPRLVFMWFVNLCLFTASSMVYGDKDIE